jgi:hypothetical protein
MADRTSAEEAPVLTPRQIITAMSGLVVAMLLAQLDNMIVAPALPTIMSAVPTTCPGWSPATSSPPQ